MVQRFGTEHLVMGKENQTDPVLPRGKRRTDKRSVPGDCLRHFRRDLWLCEVVLQSCSSWTGGFQMMGVTLQQILPACTGVRVEVKQWCALEQALPYWCYAFTCCLPQHWHIFCAGGLLNWL